MVPHHKKSNMAQQSSTEYVDSCAWNIYQKIQSIGWWLCSNGICLKPLKFVAFQETSFSYVELNASDTRSKRSLQEDVSEALNNHTLVDFFGEIFSLILFHFLIHLIHFFHSLASIFSFTWFIFLIHLIHFFNSLDSFFHSLASIFSFTWFIFLIHLIHFFHSLASIFSVTGFIFLIHLIHFFHSWFCVFLIFHFLFTHCSVTTNTYLHHPHIHSYNGL